MKRKSLIYNSIYNVFYKSLNVFFPLIASGYVAHILMPQGVGKVATAQNIVQYFVLAAALGIPNYGTREIAKVKESTQLTNKLFSELFVINGLSTVLCAVAYYMLILFSGLFEREKLLFLVTGLSIFFNVLNVDWYYQGTEEYHYIAIRSFVIKIFSLLLLIFWVRDLGDYIKYALINVMATGGNYIFNIINLKKRGVHLIYKKNNLKKHIKPIFILLCTMIAVEFYTLLDTTMISFLCKDENVAYYTSCMKIVRILITVVAAIGGVLLPKLSYYKKQNMIKECGIIVNKVFYTMLFIFLPCGIGLIMTSSAIVTLLFGKSFIPAASTLRIAALLIYALGFSNLFGTQILLTFNSEKKLLLSTIIGAISNICLNAYLIPRYQQNGAAIASVISESMVTLLTFCFASKFIRFKFEKNIVFSSLIACTTMACTVLFVKHICGNTLMSFTLQVIFGVISYVFVNLILKNPVLSELVGVVKKRRVDPINP